MTTTIGTKRADELVLGDRLSIPGTTILTAPIRFLWVSDGNVAVEFTSGATTIWPVDTELRVARTKGTS